MSGKIKEILKALKSHNDIIKEYPLTLSIEEQKLLLDYITNLQEEIERLNNDLGDMTKLFAKEREQTKRLKDLCDKYEEEHKTTFKEWKKAINIIKEVREYIEENWISQKDADNYRFDDAELTIEISDIAVLFDILDKGE